MFWSASRAIVRAALSDTFEVSAARTRRRSTVGDASRCSCAVSGTVETGRPASSAAPGRGQIARPGAAPVQLPADDRLARGATARLVVVAVHRRRRAAVEQRAARCGRASRASPPGRPDYRRGSRIPGRSARPASAAGRRPRSPSRDAASGSSPRSTGDADAEIERERQRGSRRRSAAPPARERPERASPAHHVTTSSGACRPCSGPPCCRTARSGPGAGGPSVAHARRAPPARARPPRRAATASSLTVRPSVAQRQPGGRRARRSARAGRAAVVNPKDHIPGRDAFGRGDREIGLPHAGDHTSRAMPIATTPRREQHDKTADQ